MRTKRQQSIRILDAELHDLRIIGERIRQRLKELYPPGTEIRFKYRHNQVNPSRAKVVEESVGAYSPEGYVRVYHRSGTCPCRHVHYSQIIEE